MFRMESTPHDHTSEIGYTRFSDENKSSTKYSNWPDIYLEVKARVYSVFPLAAFVSTCPQ